ncbi:hypothetical protein C7M61_002250 [Candidozyma pseudohaemuli]|uniref:Replication factor C subunit 1 n=1 Tax=Candidozyma pseudohaemuli TaxID=418784 RepID=A0A2P7YSK1_9ASCO|nr:hypothetical protein C7M61_002250 [[Candida] pseudohaemulonii]PSK38944.1 hypothetical protein C7M61_002250 [[Candida] pseudohaemulonii]
MVDIRQFFGGDKKPGSPDEAQKRSKTEDEGKSKFFEEKKSPKASPKKVKQETPKASPKKKETPKASPKKATPRKKAKPTYVNLDSDASDSEDDFKPDGDEEEDDDFDGGDFDDMKEEEEAEEEDNDLSIQEIEPEPKPVKKREAPKKAAAKPKAKTEASEDSDIDTAKILALIEDAPLPESGDSGEKMNYFQLKSKQQNVAAPSGNVQLPEAAPNCLGGLTIVFTGVLPNLDRDAAESVAKEYGGRVTKSILKKTSLVVIGEEAGPSKVKKIKDFGIKAITEKGFIELLSKMPPEGGSGKEAQAAKLKREQEEEKLAEEAREAERKEKAEEERRKARAAEQAKQAKKEGRRPPSPKREIPNNEKLWTVKYAPTNLGQICGNKGKVAKLKTWLENWHDNFKTDFKKPKNEGGNLRAVLISGPPGIGKTTAASLVAKELGYDILEKNASDVRSKSMLNQTIKNVLSNTSVVGFFKGRDADVHSKNEKKFCLIMDEVDGMSSGDHGGAGALSAFCRITKMPIILICNDKTLPKMRTFDSTAFSLNFVRPSETEVRSRLMTIALREGVKLEPSVIGQLVQATGNDIRQMINLLSTVSKTQKQINRGNSQEIANSWKKHTALKPFAITMELLGGGQRKSLNDKIDLYFNDIDFTPLMIQENYLNANPPVSPKERLERVAEAADSISESDRINSLIRSSEQQWSLLPFHAVMSSVMPADKVRGSFVGLAQFAGWLGKNSSTMKAQRLLQELHYHTRLRTSTSKDELRLDYLPAFEERLSKPLVEHSEEGISEVMETMDYYYMSRSDFDSVFDFGLKTKAAKEVAALPTKVKSAFTRKYNAAQHPVAIYKTGDLTKGQPRKQKADFEDVVEDDTMKEDEEEVVESEGIDKKDKLIKEVKPRKRAKPQAAKGAKKQKKK